MKRRDLLKKLKAAGFYMVRDDGDHTIYKKDGWLKVIKRGLAPLLDF